MLIFVCLVIPLSVHFQTNSFKLQRMSTSLHLERAFPSYITTWQARVPGSVIHIICETQPSSPVTNPYGGIGEMYIQACQGEYKNLIHVPCGGDSESVPY